MALTDNLKWQIDVNTRGRTDDEFYDHVTGALLTKSSAPTVDTSQLFGAMDLDGTDDHFTQSFPAGLSATFLDSDFTIAVRFLVDPDVAAIKKPLLIGNSAGTQRCDIGVGDTNDLIGGAFDTPSGTDEFETSAVDAGDGKAHVVVWRRSGNNFTLWIDGVKTNDVTTAVGTMGTMNQINVGRRGGTSGTQWHFPGLIFWAAIWSDDISDGDLATLHTSINPFLTEEDGDYVFGTAGSTLHFAPAGAGAGDQIIMETTAGAGALIPTLADVQPTTMPMTFNVWAWDVSALTLLSRPDITVFLGQNRVVDAFTDTNGTALPSHTPDVDDFGGGWAYAAENDTLSTPSSGVTIESNNLRISSGGAGAVIDTDDVNMQIDATIVVDASTNIHTIQFAWQDSANRLSLKITADTGVFQLNQRHIGAAFPNFGNGTFDLSALGEFAVTIVFEDGAVDVYCDGTQVITGAVPPRAVATTATKAGLFSIDQAGSYPVEYGSFSANAEAAAERSLTVSDSTLTPGQTATFTLVGTNYGATIDDVTFAGVAETPANADVNSFDLTAPAQAEYVAGGDHEGTGWYRNVPVISETDAEVSVQIVAPIPANFGVLGALELAEYAPEGLIEGDEVYAVIDGGAGTFFPETCSFLVTSGPLSATIYGYSVSSGAWVAPRSVSDLSPPAVLITTIARPLRRLLHRRA